MDLSDSRPGPPKGYFFPNSVVAGATPRRASQVPRPICQHAPSPITPESQAAAFTRCFTAGTGLHLSWTDGHSQKCNEAEMGSLSLRLTPSPHEASPDRVTPSHARSATCQTGNLQGELLSVRKIGQASPGAPGSQDKQDIFAFPEKRQKASSLFEGKFCYYERSLNLRTV